MPRRAATYCLHIAVLLMSGSAALLVVGCGPSAQEQQRAKAQEDFRESFARHDVDMQSEDVLHPNRVLVAQGRSPVVFGVREPVKAHVVDLTTGAELVATNVGREQFISVNEETGVLVGTQRIVSGPLPQGHEFGILVDVSGDESFKSKVTTNPVPPPRMKPFVVEPPAPPTTKPAPVFAPTTAPAPVGDDSRSN
jgi:hypothetical protein